MPLWHNTDGSVMSKQWMELVQKIRLLPLKFGIEDLDVVAHNAAGLLKCTKLRTVLCE